MNTICTAVAVAIVASTVPTAAIDMDQWPEVASDAQGNLQIKAPAIFINNILFNPADLASKDDLADAVEPLKATQQMLVTTLELLKTAQATASTLQADLKTSQQALMFVLEQVVPANAEVPVGCQVSTWSTWTKCSQTCGKGDRTRTRTSKTFPGIAGVSCPASSERETCEIKKCAVDCEVGDWSEFAGCMPSCGPNSKQCKHRTVVTPAAYGGGACGTTYECRNCNATCPEGSCPGVTARTVEDLAVLKDCAHVNGSIYLVNMDATADGANELMASYTSAVAEVTGNINMFNVKGISSLEMFAGLVTVGGDFAIVTASGMTSVGGTTLLTAIGGDFTMQSVQGLSKIGDGFDQLATIGGDFEMSTISLSGEFDGFHGVKEVGGSFTMQSVQGLSKIGDGFDQLATIGGDFLCGDFSLSEGIDAFHGVKEVGGSVAMMKITFSTEKNATVKAFGSVTKIGKAVDISIFRCTGGCANGITIDVFGALASIGERLQFSHWLGSRNAVKSIKPFKLLTHIGLGISLIGMTALPPRVLNEMFPKLKVVNNQNHRISSYSLISINQVGNVGNQVGLGSQPFDDTNSAVLFPALENAGEINIVSSAVDLRGAFPKLVKCGNVLFSGCAIHHASTPFSSLEDIISGYEESRGGFKDTSTIQIHKLGPCSAEIDSGKCMQSLEGWFPKLKNTQTLEIETSSAITGLGGFESLESIGDLSIDGMPSLAVCKSSVDRLTKISSSAHVNVGLLLADC